MADDAVNHWLSAAGRHPQLTPSEVLHLGAIVRAWQDHPDGPGKAPAALMRRGRRARDRIVTGNLRLVSTVAKRMPARHGIELADRLQAGAVGLVKAAERFDPARGYKFSTFAYWWIYQAIGKHSKSQWLIRVPTNVVAHLHGQKDGRISAWQLEAGAVAASVCSLDGAASRDSPDVSSLLDLLGSDDPDLTALEHVKACRAALAAMIATDSAEFTLLELHHGHGLTVSELAALEGCTVQAMGKRLQQASKRLRGIPQVHKTGILPAAPVATLLDPGGLAKPRQLSLAVSPPPSDMGDAG